MRKKLSGYGIMAGRKQTTWNFFGLAPYCCGSIGETLMTNLAYGVKLATTKSIEALEAWLEKNCRGQWKVELENISGDLKKKNVLVLFKNDTERGLFKKHYSSI